MIRKIALVAFICAFNALYAQQRKAPAYPLITHDPYFSIWSMGDNLNEETTKHWTGRDHSLLGMINVDGKTYRFLGKKSDVYKDITPAADVENYKMKYTESAPAKNWMKSDFDDSNWNTAIAPIGNIRGVSKTMWESRDIWVRREFNLENVNFDPFIKVRNDDEISL